VEPVKWVSTAVRLCRPEVLKLTARVARPLERVPVPSRAVPS
jgi:hypothetical protein